MWKIELKPADKSFIIFIDENKGEKSSIGGVFFAALYTGSVLCMFST